MSMPEIHEVILETATPSSEWSEQFLNGMLARMGMSYFKYGKVTDAYPAKVDALASLRERLALYQQTGNTEWLMDVANFAMIEFMHPAHPNYHYSPTDSDQSPGRIWRDGRARAAGNEGENFGD